MGTFRRFGAAELKIAEDWAQTAVGADKWTAGAPVGVGESCSLHVVRDDGVRGFAKPAIQPGGRSRAGAEKVAADLAHLLEVPVPGVTLWTNPACGSLYSISCRAFQQPLSWGEALQAGALTPTFLKNASEALAAGYVFHCWIGDTDHGGNPGNVIVDASHGEDNPSLAFIDHAFSMDWAAADAPVCHIGGYYQPFDQLPKSALAEMSQRIESLTLDQIRAVVERIPLAFLDAAKADLLIQGLSQRKACLKAALGLP